MHTGHVQQGRNTSSFASSSAVSVGLHLTALRPQTGESGAFARGSCQPRLDQLDLYELFPGPAQCHQRLLSI